MSTIKTRALTLLALIALGFGGQSSWADGTDIIVPKGATDGTITATPDDSDETYPSGGSGTFSNGKGTFKMLTYRNGDGSIEQIHFYFEVSDGAIAPGDAGDQIQVRFDLDHEHTNSSIDRGFRVIRVPEGGATNNVRLTDINLFADPSDIGGGDLPAGQWSVDDDVGGTDWTAEVTINASDLGLNYIPSIVGMHIFVNDDGNTDGNYPNVNKSAITTWANLKTRNDLEYVLLLDRSGSMDSSIDGTTTNSERWNAAKTASDIFAQLFYAVRSAEDGTSTPYFNDKIGMATFSTNNAFMTCSGTTDESAVVKSLSSLNGITVDGYTDDAPAPGSPTGCTPIQGGLNEAFSMFATTGDAERIVLLLSDGFHNVPSSTYDHAAYVYPGALTRDDFQVNTVALSDDDDLDDNVGTELLDAIKDDFSGFGNAYIDASSRSSLVDAFVENLFGHLYLNKTEVDGATGNFTVNANEPRIIVMLVWHSDSGSDRGFRLRRPDASIIDTGDAGYHHFRNTTLGYEVAYYVVETPTSGTWRTIETASTSAEIADNNLAIFDPTIYAFFTATQSGSDFVLKAVLKENGVPMQEPDAEVKVTISKPDEGLGTYAATAQRDCGFADPALPSVGSIKERLALKGQYQYSVATNLSGSASSAAGGDNNQQSDVQPLHIQYVHEIFKLCGKLGLNRTDGITLKLYDDGTHGDQTAGDGVFTLRYTDTDIEGTYKFNFSASGTAPSGSAFSRVKKLSAHNKVVPSDTFSIFDFRDIQIIDGMVYREYFVIPKSDANQYVGPGHLNNVAFDVVGAEKVGAVQDYLNGVYSQMVVYPQRDSAPTVKATVNGVTITQADTGGGGFNVPWYCWLILLILIILVLFIFLLRKA